MELHTLSLEGFRSYREPVEIDFRATPHAAVVGDNGAGKTSLLEAIEWALYGTSRSDDRSGVISIGKEQCVVHLGIRVASDHFEIKRTRQNRTKAGGGTLDLYRIGEDAHGYEAAECLSEKTVSLTQAAIISLIGVTREVFLSCAMIKQGDHGRFTRAKPAARRALLREMLRLDSWEATAKNARARSLEASRQADVEEAHLSSARLASATDRHAHLTHVAAQLAADEKAADAQHVAAALHVESCVVDVGRAEQALKQVSLKAAAYSSAKRASEEASRALQRAQQISATAQRTLERQLKLAEVVKAGGGDEHVSLEKEREELAAQLKVLAARIQENSQRSGDLRIQWGEAQNDVRAISARIARAQSESEIVDKVPCDEDCGRRCPLLELAHSRRDEIAGLVRDLEAARERKRAAGEAGQSLAAELQEANAAHKKKMSAWDAVGRKLDQINGPIAAARAGLEFSSVEDAQRDADAARAACQEQERAAEAARLRLEDTDPPNTVALQAAAGAASATLSHARDAALSAASLLRDIRQKISSNTTELALVNAVLDELKERRAALKKAQADTVRWKRVCDAAQLAPILLIEELAIPALETVANEILSTISDGMSVRIETQRQLKSTSGTSERIDIIIRDDVGERPFEDYSGGEQFRVNIAMALALSSLSQHDSQSPLNCIFLDEGWGSLDKDGIAGLSEVVSGLAEFYDLVWVITHVEAAAECLPAQVRIQAGPNGSTVECR